jgi:hypothetical protein
VDGRCRDVLPPRQSADLLLVRRINARREALNAAALARRSSTPLARRKARHGCATTAPPTLRPCGSVGAVGDGRHNTVAESCFASLEDGAPAPAHGPPRRARQGDVRLHRSPFRTPSEGHSSLGGSAPTTARTAPHPQHDHHTETVGAPRTLCGFCT